MAACLQGFFVELSMLLHVCEVDHEIERSARQHFVNVRISLWNFENRGLLLSPFKPDITNAYKVNIRRFLKMGKVNIGDTSTADDADPDFFFRIEMFSHREKWCKG